MCVHRTLEMLFTPLEKRKPQKAASPPARGESAGWHPAHPTYQPQNVEDVGRYLMFTGVFTYRSGLWCHRARAERVAAIGKMAHQPGIPTRAACRTSVRSVLVRSQPADTQSACWGVRLQLLRLRLSADLRGS